MMLTSRDTLRALMAQKEFSRRSLARSCGLSGSGMVDHLVDGRKHSCSPRLAARIAEALDVPLSLLFLPSAPSSDRASSQQSVAWPIHHPHRPGGTR